MDREVLDPKTWDTETKDLRESGKSLRKNWQTPWPCRPRKEVRVGGGGGKSDGMLLSGKFGPQAGTCLFPLDLPGSRG